MSTPLSLGFLVTLTLVSDDYTEKIQSMQDKLLWDIMRYFLQSPVPCSSVPRKTNDIWR